MKGKVISLFLEARQTPNTVPPILVFQVEVRDEERADEGSVWEEAFGSYEAFVAFVKGLEAMARMLDVPHEDFETPRIPGHDQVTRWMAGKDKLQLWPEL